MPEADTNHDRSGRYHVNEHGAGSFYIDHLPCTDHNCRREHHYLLSYDSIADIVTKYIIDCGNADKPAAWSDDHSVEYYVVSGDDYRSFNHARSHYEHGGCDDSSCPDWDYLND